MKKPIPTLLKSLLIILLVGSLYALHACGGGSGDDTGDDSSDGTAPAAPTVTLGYGIKQLQFSWDAVEGADYYTLLENPDGISGYTQVGANLTTTSVNHTIALHRRVNARYIVEACNTDGCTASSTLDLAANLIPAIGYVKASNTEADDYFGDAIAISGDGNTLAVGASNEGSDADGINGDETDNSAGGSGAVYVYVRSGSAWSQQAYVKASNSDQADVFGYTLSLSDDGNTLAVGASGEKSNATGINGNQTDNSLSTAGAAYVFSRSGSTWTQQAYVKASNTDAQDFFGDSVALSGDGNTLAVGARGEDSNHTGISQDGTGESDNSDPNSGAVYVFSRSSSTWSQQAYVKPPVTGVNLFGYTVSLDGDGNTLAISDGTTAYIATRDVSDVWSHQTSFIGDNTEAVDSFGYALDLSGDGNTLAVGAYREESNATGINGNGADNSLSSAGAVYVFTRSGSSWSQQAYIKASNTGDGDNFGYSVSLSPDGNNLAVGAYGEGSNGRGVDANQSDNSMADAGAAFVFTRSGSSWLQQAYVKASNTDTDSFGDSIDISNYGAVLAVSAVEEDSSATGIGGDQTDDSASRSGAAYLY